MSDPWTWKYLYRLVNERFFLEFREGEVPRNLASNMDLFRYEKYLSLDHFCAIHVVDCDDHTQLYLPCDDDKVRVVVDIAQMGTNSFYIRNVQILFDIDHRNGPGFQQSVDNNLGYEAMVASLLADCTVDNTERELKGLITRFNGYFRGDRFRLTQEKDVYVLEINKHINEKNVLCRCFIKRRTLIQRIELSHVFLDMFVNDFDLMPCGLDLCEKRALQLIMSFADVDSYIGVETLKKELVDRLVKAYYTGCNNWGEYVLNKFFNVKQEKKKIVGIITERVNNIRQYLPNMELARLLEDDDYSDSLFPF